MKSCFTVGLLGDIVVGTLSHSHMLLFLLCLVAQAKWDVTDDEGNFIFPCDRRGYIDLAAVAAKDDVLRQILAEGIDMEILSHKIYIEEPSACTLISNALNHVNKVAFETTEIHAISVLTGKVGLSAITDKLNFDAIKTELRSTLDDMADDPDFIHMFDLVAQLGADRNSYLPDFLEFTSKCVSSKFRRLRMQTFAVLTKIKAGPLAKIALAKRSLRSKPTGLMCPPPESELEKREEADFENLETILFFFHTKCKGGTRPCSSRTWMGLPLMRS